MIDMIEITLDTKNFLGMVQIMRDILWFFPIDKDQQRIG